MSPDQGNCFNISLGEVTYTSGDVIPGSSIQLDFPISNLGTEPIESVYIEVLNSEDEVLHSFNIYQNLLPGETMAAYVMYNLPDSVETLANHTVRVMVTIPEQEDVDTMDNFREINIERNTVLIDEVNVFKFGETYQVTANVANYGFTSVANLVLSLSKDSETGDLLAQETIDSLDAWDMQAVTFTLSAETLGINDEKSETLLYMSLTREDSYQDSDYFVIEDRFDFIPVTSITVSAGATEITTESGTLQMHARVEPENATNKSVIWSLSCGSEYATITETGLLTAIDNGVVTVRATATDSSNVYGETQIAISGQPVTSIAQPVISVEPDLDTYLPCAITVTISCSTPGVNIYYTTDGSLPTSSTGLLFTGPFSLTPGTTKATERIICAVAVKAGIPDSTISTRTVSFLDAMHRVAGSNRYATAAAIGKEGWDSSTTVVLARGDNSADALAGVPLAFAYNAPILLTSTYRLSAVTREEIIRLGASKVIILGGEGAVSESVAQVLRGELHVEVERVSGKNRFATAAEVAKKLTDISGSAHKAILAYGLDFPDALASASYAAMAGYPILLVRTDRLTEDTKAVIAELNIHDIILVGGSGVISDELMSQLSSAVRISGSNRYSTAVELAKYFAPASSGVYFATGLDFADAITGCVLAAKNNSGLLLVHPDRAFASVQDYIVESGCMWATVFGGTGAVNDDVASIIEELIGRQYAAKAQVAIR